MIKTLCILGAGTSGLASALILKQAYPTLDVTVVKSSEIEIVGVGEGSTEHWSAFMHFVGITPGDLVREAGATAKYGIKFDNWNGNSKSYFHSVVAGLNAEDPLGYLYVYHKLFAEHDDPFTGYADFVATSELHQPVEHAVAQFHFDTFKLNNFLQQKCLEKGINILTDTINDVILDDNGIKQIVGNTSTYTADFFLDCTGFRRVLINKLGAEWQSVQEYLPLNSAFTFATELDPSVELPAWTRATALNSGWAFQIPTQERFGNGYIYCDKFTDEETALKEAEEYVGQKITIGRRFKFDAGYLKETWIKNCMAIGLSANFVEPLEATSIGSSLQQAFALSAYLKSWSKETPMASDTFNTQFTGVFKNIVDFIQLHYITKREDTPFWKYCKTMKLTDFNERTLPIFKKNMPIGSLFTAPFSMFRNSNWAVVLWGLGLFDLEAIKTAWQDIPTEARMEAGVKLHIIRMQNSQSTPMGHRAALEHIKEHH